MMKLDIYVIDMTQFDIYDVNSTSYMFLHDN